jgi:hypothetical protein
VDFQEVVNVTEYGDCSGDSDINPQGDAHEATGGARSLLAAAMRLATWPCGKSVDAAVIAYFAERHIRRLVPLAFLSPEDQSGDRRRHRSRQLRAPAC